MEERSVTATLAIDDQCLTTDNMDQHPATAPLVIDDQLRIMTADKDQHSATATLAIDHQPLMTADIEQYLVTQGTANQSGTPADIIVQPLQI